MDELSESMSEYGISSLQGSSKTLSDEEADLCLYALHMTLYKRFVKDRAKRMADTGDGSGLLDFPDRSVVTRITDANAKEKDGTFELPDEPAEGDMRMVRKGVAEQYRDRSWHALPTFVDAMKHKLIFVGKEGCKHTMRAYEMIEDTKDLEIVENKLVDPHTDTDKDEIFRRLYDPDVMDCPKSHKTFPIIAIASKPPIFIGGASDLQAMLCM